VLAVAQTPGGGLLAGAEFVPVHVVRVRLRVAVLPGAGVPPERLVVLGVAQIDEVAPPKPGVVVDVTVPHFGGDLEAGQAFPLARVEIPPRPLL